MIVLDTNVISEAMKPEPAAMVRRWLDDQADGTLYITTITQAEIQFGIARLPAGKNQNRLATAYAAIERIFSRRILSFDSDAARYYGTLAAAAQAAGRGFPTPDGYIAAIAASHGFAVATRDTGPFLAGGVEVLNPWSLA